MNKIAIITAATFPVPSVRGGAVETLIDQLLQENEKQNTLDITVYSVYDYDAVSAAAQYKNSKFVFYRFSHTFERYTNLFCRILWKVFRIKVNNKLLVYKAAKHINKSDCDLILIENRPEFVLPVFRKNGPKIILHLHNDYLNSDTADHKKETISACNKVITVSQFIERKVMTIGGKHDNKVLVLKNCTNISLFNRDLYSDYRREFRKRHNIHDDDTVIMFSGRLHPAKGIKELLLGFREVRIDNIWLLIVGSMWYGSSTRDDFVRELELLSQNISKRIIFTGYIPYNDMAKIYSVSDISVTPSVWDEPAGLVVLEAMATGLPLIVTDSGGIPEYVNDKCAIMVNRGDELANNLTAAMRKLILHKDLRDDMGRAGKVFAEQFNSEKYFENFVNIMDTTIKGE